MPSPISTHPEKDSRLLVWPNRQRLVPSVRVVPASTADAYVAGKAQQSGPAPVRTPHMPLPPSPKGNLLSQNVVASDLADRAGFRDQFAHLKFKFTMYRLLGGLDSEQQFAIKSIFTDCGIHPSKWMGLASTLATLPKEQLADAAMRPHAWATHLSDELLR